MITPAPWLSPHQIAFQVVKKLHDHLRTTSSVHPQAFAALQDFGVSIGMHALKKPLRKKIEKVLLMSAELSKRESVLHRMLRKELHEGVTDDASSYEPLNTLVGDYVLPPKTAVGTASGTRPKDVLLSEYFVKRTELLRVLAELTDEFQTFWGTYYH